MVLSTKNKKKKKGIHLIIIISKSNANRISRIVTDDYKSGFKGILGNKGCVSASFFYDDSEVILILIIIYIYIFIYNKRY